MRFKRLEIRHRIKEKANLILKGEFIAILKFCLLFTAIYLVIEYIKLYAAPILEMKSEGIAGLINAYLGMTWQQLLSIFVINLLAIIVVGPLLCSFCTFFLHLTPSGLVSEEGNADRIRAQHREEAIPTIGQSMLWFMRGELRTKAIVLRTTTTLLSMMWHVLFCGPPLFFLYHLRGNPNSVYYANALFIYMTWMLLGFLFAYVKNGTYYPAYFLIAQDPQMSVIDAIRDSVKMMQGHAWEFLSYKLSFLPWYLAAVVTFGAGLLYIIPYRGISDTLFIRYIDTESSGEYTL